MLGPCYTILEYNPGVESFILGLDLVPARQSKPQNSPFCAMFRMKHKTVPFFIGQSVGCSYNSLTEFDVSHSSL